MRDFGTGHGHGKGAGEQTSSRPRTPLILLHITIWYQRPADINRIRRIQPRRRLLHAMHDRVRPVQSAEIEIMLISQHLGAVDRAQRRGVEREEQRRQRGHCHAGPVDMHRGCGWELSSGEACAGRGRCGRKEEAGACSGSAMWVGWADGFVSIFVQDLCSVGWRRVGEEECGCCSCACRSCAACLGHDEVCSRTCCSNRQGTSLGT